MYSFQEARARPVKCLSIHMHETHCIMYLSRYRTGAESQKQQVLLTCAGEMGSRCRNRGCQLLRYRAAIAGAASQARIISHRWDYSDIWRQIWFESRTKMLFHCVCKPLFCTASVTYGDWKNLSLRPSASEGGPQWCFTFEYFGVGETSRLRVCMHSNSVQHQNGWP